MDHSGGFGGPQFSQTFHGVCWSIIIFPREDRATVRYPSSLHGFAISTLSQQAVTTLWALHSWGINMCSITMTYSRHIYIYAYILEKLKLHKYFKKNIYIYCTSKTGETSSLNKPTMQSNAGSSIPIFIYWMISFLEIDLSRKLVWNERGGEWIQALSEKFMWTRFRQSNLPSGNLT